MTERGQGADSWDVDAISLFRVLGYVVGLPSFIVGTALFMLGFSLLDEAVLNAACILYSLAFVAISGRVVLALLNPRNEKQALMVILGSLVSMILIYALLITILWGLGFIKLI